MTHTKEPTQSAKGPAVYGIECPQTGRMYVGSTTNVDARKSQHMCNLRRGNHHNRELQSAYDDNPDLNFIIERTDTFEAAQRREQEILDYGMPRGELLNKAPNAYNPAVGWERSAETKARIGAAAKELHTGKPKSPEHVEKMRQNALGKIPSAETRRKMSESREGKPLSEEHKAAIGLGNLGRVPTDETKRKLREDNPLLKPVVIDGTEYISISDASRTLELKKGTVHYRVESHTEKFSGWKYKEEE